MGIYHTLILEFDNMPINIMVVKCIFLSKEDTEQFLQFTQYVDEHIIKPDFSLFSLEKTLTTKFCKEYQKQ